MFYILFPALNRKRRLGDNYDDGDDAFLEAYYTIENVSNTPIPAFRTEGRDHIVRIDNAATYPERNPGIHCPDSTNKT